MTALVVAAAVVAGGAGALVRWVVTQAFARRQRRLPWAVLVVNVAGSLLAGVLLGAASTADPAWAFVLVSGFCGGLTTFSTFSVETVQLVLAGRGRAAVASVVLNVVLGVGACAVGYVVAGALLP